MQPNNPFPQTFLDLARSLYAGNVAHVTMQWEMLPGQIDDVEFHVYMVVTQKSMTGIFAELNKRFERVYIPGVVEWVRQ